MELVLSAYQFTPGKGEPEANLEQVRKAARSAAEKGACLMLLPELWASGPVMSRQEAHAAARASKHIVPALTALSKELGLSVAGGLCIEEEGRFYNSLVLTAPDETLQVYKKIHLFAPFSETEVFSPGRRLEPMELSCGGGLVAGPMVCFDIRFPETARHLVRQGAQLLMVSAMWPLSRIDNFELLLRARAMESQVFVLAANACGLSGGMEFGGSSMCCGPDGREMFKADSASSGLKFCTIDLTELEQRRSLFSSSVSPQPWLLDSSRKVMTLEELKKAAGRRRAFRQRMVFTNGCFDILHAGHVSYLEQARGFGDFLVVGLNSDSSVRSIKGPERPINPEAERARVLAALSCVDYVVIFSEETPLRLIEALSPDVLVKGADWAEEQIVGADLVKSRGGRVERIEFQVETSTTSIIRRISSKAS